MVLLAGKGGGSSHAVFPGAVPGAAGPRHPPTAGCNINLSAQLCAPLLKGFFAISNSLCWTFVSVEQEMEEQAPLLSCFCIFSNTVIPQTRGKRFKPRHFQGVLQ